MTSIQQGERASGMGEANGKKGGARVVYLYSSPLVQRVGGRKERMVQLGKEKEKEMIRETLRNTQSATRFCAMVATRSSVGGILNDGCQMIHYVGHGDGERLSFESDDDRQCGVMEAFEVNELEDLLRTKHAWPQLVLISSCYSELSGNAFVRAGVRHVVAVKSKEAVTDDVARLFSQELYKALFGTQRHSMQDAFDIASSIVCNKLNAGNSKQQGGPFILLPSDGNHDVPIFDRLPGNFIEETPPLPEVYPCLPRSRDTYLGEEALQKVVDALVNPCAACVTVVGGRGSGKTERVIQACKYVRERRRFDAIFFATWDKPALGWMTQKDLCSLVGQALGMEPAPSSIEQLADLLFKQEEEGPPPRTVLLVLDGVDELVEEGDQDARDELLDFLCSLCERKDAYNLKLLVTSNVRLQHDSSLCFRAGSEQVLKIAPLEGTDPAQLFFNAVSRKLTRGELGVAPVCSHAELLEALGEYLTEAKGHPETLVRLASSVDDNNLLSPSFAKAAVRIWKECNPILTSPFQNNRTGAPRQRLRRGGRQRQFTQITEQELRGYAPHQQFRREDRQRRIEHQGLLQRSREYVDPQLCLQQQAPGTASEAELTDLGYLSVWLQAVKNAQADGRRYDGRTDRAPLKCLSDVLRKGLHEQHVVSSNHFHTGDDSLHDFLPGGRVELAESESDDAADTPTPRGISDKEMNFVEERLVRTQNTVACGGGGTRTSGPDDGDKQDTISIEAFVQFCKWWAPVMATLSQLRDDRQSTTLVRMHWFMGRQAAVEMLSGKEAGTFLLRFSETRVGALVISLKENVPSTEASTSSAPRPLDLPVVNYLVEVDGRGRCCFIHERLEMDEGGSGLAVYRRRHVGSYTSLHDIILRSEMMRTLYPDIPKEEAFRQVPSFSAPGGSLVVATSR